MYVHVSPTRGACGRAAAARAAAGIAEALALRGAARLVVATGASQFEFLADLVSQPLDWSCVTAFHLDEYIGLPSTHPASFRGYLRERFVRHLPVLGAFHEIDGEAADPQAECRRLGGLLREAPVDVACIGIGENGHVAFNDPPADFETADPYLVVTLDAACRRQQVGEGWFTSLQEVPRQAISMSVRQILQSRLIVCTVPDARKAEAVKGAVEGPVTPIVPASILQRHPACHLFLDGPAASLLARKPREETS
jgi:glucosamine-6-phosphate deaminase